MAVIQRGSSSFRSQIPEILNATRRQHSRKNFSRRVIDQVTERVSTRHLEAVGKSLCYLGRAAVVGGVPVRKERYHARGEAGIRVRRIDPRPSVNRAQVLG